MFAVVHTGANQERVEVGDFLRIPHHSGGVGDEVLFDKVLLLKDDSGIRAGAPARMPESSLSKSTLSKSTSSPTPPE